MEMIITLVVVAMLLMIMLAAMISTITTPPITTMARMETTPTTMKMPAMLKKEEGPGPRPQQEKERGDLRRPSSRPASSATSATPMEYGFGYRTIATW